MLNCGAAIHVSSVYREAMIDVLRFRLRGVEIPLRYQGSDLSIQGLSLFAFTG